MTDTLRQLTIDAFTDEPFKGNAAAVVPLTEWLPDATMAAIAGENNLSETVFFVPVDAPDADFHLRWFTPKLEVNLCGHATLATGHALFEHLDWRGDEIRFQSRGGPLVVRRRDGRVVLDFPRIAYDDVEIDAALVDALGKRPLEVYRATDETYGEPTTMAVFGGGEQVAALDPDFRALRSFLGGVIATAPGASHDVDFVSRYFAPYAGIDEDPVTGSVHCMLAPFWGTRLGRSALTARQISTRGGDLLCTVRGNRVEIAGKCVTIFDGRLLVPVDAATAAS